jgi:hypothetical protein
MSTSYFFINKEKAKDYKEYLKVVQMLKKTITDEVSKTKVYQNEWNQDTIDGIIQNFEYNMDFRYDYGRIEIGTKTSNRFIFSHLGDFYNIEAINKFYKENKDKYDIMNEYLEPTSIEELNKIIKGRNE